MDVQTAGAAKRLTLSLLVAGGLGGCAGHGPAGSGAYYPDSPYNHGFAAFPAASGPERGPPRPDAAGRHDGHARHA